ncbi:MAG TPA: ATP-binding protein [Methylomirabilota bacterium]|jgi:signal transduction histidine kinase/CheY-like chemotaxis protein
MTPTKILYIEDSPDNRMLVRALLPASQYLIVEAEDGLAGITAALREEPALILLDINLPGIDGYEVGVALRSLPALRNTPIIAVTAYAMQGDRERTLVAGCDGYIAKPLDVDTFAQQVGEFLRGKRERLEERQEGPFLRELNQRLVYRMVRQIEELQSLNDHVVRHASQLEALHAATQGITSALDVRTMLERLLPELARAIGATVLTVELVEPADLQVSVQNPEAKRAPSPSPLGEDGEERREIEWAVPLVVQQRDIGLMTGRTLASAKTKADDEQVLKIVASQVAIAVENARLYEGVTRKMAELRETQAQLIQAAKLAAIGEMAAQVAHEINNPLTSVLGFASLLVEQLPADSSLHADAGLIMTEASRARDIVRDLLDFSRQRPFFPQTIDVNGVLRQAVGLIRLQGVMSVTIDEQYADDLPPIEVDPARMKQVFLNIINNAVQAMPKGGLLTVRTGASVDEVTVAFADTGPGIAPEHRERIFEPFFTTKSEVNGTGLGLAVSLGIVRQHGGTIDLVSELGKGSTFTIRIPRTRREGSSAA